MTRVFFKVEDIAKAVKNASTNGEPRGAAFLCTHALKCSKRFMPANRQEFLGDEFGLAEINTRRVLVLHGRPMFCGGLGQL